MPAGQGWLDAWPEAEIRVLIKPGIDAASHFRRAPFPLRDRLRDWAHAARPRHRSSATTRSRSSPCPPCSSASAKAARSSALGPHPPPLDPMPGPLSKPPASTTAPAGALLLARSSPAWPRLATGATAAVAPASRSAHLPVTLARGAWGERDERIPPAAYARFAALATPARAAELRLACPLCQPSATGLAGDGIA